MNKYFLLNPEKYWAHIHAIVFTKNVKIVNSAHFSSAKLT